MKNILLTGGAGYIGSHTAVALSHAGYQVVIIDNFCNSDKSVLDRLHKIVGSPLNYVEGDIRNKALVAKVIKDYKVEAVIHFAGLKAVGESVKDPIQYYDNNVQGTISLLSAMKSASLKKLIFSSSATVYGEPKYLPIDENHPTGATNAYGRSKLHIEEMLLDVSNSDPDWKIICLRYFNPVGAHESGLIGEDPNGIPNNLVPYISQVAVGRIAELNIYGDDYLTHDGTGVRDYIHVMDLAEGHLAALNYICNHCGWTAVNLGTGKGSSVLEMLKVYEQASGKKIHYSVKGRRPGDIASCFAKVERAISLFNWKAERTLLDMCSSGWMWQQYRKTWS